MDTTKVFNQTRDNTIGDSIEVAETSWTRMRGLLGRKGIDAGGGLWIRPCSGVHMFFMTFPIDVVGLDKHHRVIKLWSHLAPWRITSVSLKMASALELPAGRIAGCGIEVGDQLSWTST
jgi:uncharacterized membrane protein (UPF0127 family)